jgi:hypothetical protein
MPETQEVTETRNFPAAVREARFLPESINAEARTAELIWSTGADVMRMDGWTGQRWVERLSMDPGAIRMGRLQSGAPLLDTHNSWSLRGILGVVDSATIVAGEGRATVRFADTPDVEPVWRMVEQKIIRNVSVGYIIHRMKDVSKEEDKVRTLEAVDWEPTEISLVPVGADAGAGVRSERPDTYPCTIIRALPEPGPSEENPMTEVSGNPPANNGARAEDAVATAIAAAVTDTRADQKPAAASFKDVTAAVRAVGLDMDYRDALFEKVEAEGLTIEAARSAIFDHLAEKGDKVETRNHAQVTRDEVDTVRSLAENAFLHRHAPDKFKLEDGARQFMGRSLLEIGDDLLERRGVSTKGVDKMTRAGLIMGFDTRSGALSTSDFPYILANVANKTLRMGYEAAPRTFLPIARRVTIPDFKQVQRTQLGSAPKMRKVTEEGEFTYGYLGEGKEVYSLATYGRIVPITRQAIINDDMGAFTRIPQLMGQASANLESDVVWAIITANAALNDGITLFHSSHANLAGSGAAPDITTIGAAMTAIGSQTGLDSDDTTYLNLQGRYLVGGWNTDLVRKQMTSANYVPVSQATQNVYSGLIPITEARLTGNAWYVFCSPDQIDTIEYAYLDGQDGVYLETRQGFEVDGIEIKARHDFAAKAIDYRGMYKNAGS